MSLTYHAVATWQTSGPLIQSLTASQAASLAYHWAVNRAAFNAQASALVNGRIQAIEQNEPEGQRNELTIHGWGSGATAAAHALNQKWQSGQLTGRDGKSITAWPEHPHQIAWAPDAGTLRVRWRKEGPVLWLIIGALIVLVGYVIYRVLRHGSYTLQTANSPSNSSQSHSPVSVGSGGVKLFGVQWYWWLGGAGALAVTPWAYRKVVRIKQDEAQSIAANRAIQEAKHSG